MNNKHRSGVRYMGFYMDGSLPLFLSRPLNARLRCPYWSPSLRAVCLILAGLLLDSLPPSLSLSAGKIIIRLLHDDYPTVCGCNTRNKRAVSWCGGSDDKLNKSAAHLAPLGETHVRTSVFGNEPVFSKSSPTTRIRVFLCKRRNFKRRDF